MSESKTLINNYLGALSGQPKTPELVRTYVADERLIQHIAEVEAAFPNYELVAEDLLAEDDKVVVRGTFRGVQRRTFAGVAPTGKAVSAGLMIIYRVERSRIVDHWMQFDLFALMQQIQSTSDTMSA